MNVGKLPNKFCVEIHNLEQGEIIKRKFLKRNEDFDINNMLNNYPDDLCLFVDNLGELEYCYKDYYLRYPRDYGKVLTFGYVLSCIGGHKYGRKVSLGGY